VALREQIVRQYGHLFQDLQDEALESLIPQLVEEVAVESMKKFELTVPQRHEVADILDNEGDELIIDAFNIEMKTSTIACLRQGAWLNDEVINFYMSLLDERNKRNLANKTLPPAAKLKIHFFNSFFYTKLIQNKGYCYADVKRWSKRANVDIISLDKVVIPVHVHGDHWCLAVINFQLKRFEYYDSLGGRNSTCLKNLRQYVKDEAKEHKKLDYNFAGWTDYVPDDIPHQRNGCDCGVFTAKFADYLSENREFNFSQDDMPYFRRRMVLEIKYKKVL
jgi:sentrin-specific protease 1